MRKFPLISILVNCYNSEKFISECINSLLNQTYKNIEIIIWDNCSTDNTSKIINNFDDNRIRYYKSEVHTLLSKARILASEKINGEYVAIVDSDDLAYKNKIYEQFDYFSKNNNLSLLGTWMGVINDNGKLIDKYEPEFKKYSLQSQLIWCNPLVHSSIMYKRSVAVDLGWYSKKLTNFQDYGLTLKILSKYEIGMLNKNLGARRVHGLNNIKNKKTYLSQIREYELLLRYARLIIINKYENQAKLLDLNKKSLLVNKFKYLLFIFKNNINFSKFYKLVKFILCNPVILLHNGYIRKYLIK